MQVNVPEQRSARFTPRVQRVIEYAREEAIRQRAPSILTRHLLSAFVREGHGLIARLLGASGVSLDVLQREIEDDNLNPSALSDRSSDVELAEILPVAAEEADSLGNAYISTEHLLLAMLRAADSVAGKLLAHKGVDVDSVRGQIVALTARGSHLPTSGNLPLDSEGEDGLKWLV